MCAALLLWCGLAAVQALPQVAEADDRRHFDFLVGTWVLDQRVDVVRGSTEFGDDRYTFTQPIRGGAIHGNWRFNRGTAARPDVTEALYVSGYHGPSRAWSFYYVSERSAQHWIGRRDGDRWVFYFDEPFDYEGRRAVQRQWWERESADRIRRHFENSYDGGASWQRVMTSVLRRIG